MNSFREILWVRQRELSVRLIKIMEQSPTPLNRIRKEMGISTNTLVDFLAKPLDRPLAVTTIFKMEDWCNRKEKELSNQPPAVDKLMIKYAPVLEKLAKE